MQSALSVDFLVLVCYCFIQNVSSIAMNLNPPNGSLITQSIGTVNTSTLECDIFQNNDAGDLVQITTTWTLQNFRSNGNDIILVVQSEFEGVFLIGGTPRPPGSFSPTYRNRITVLNFTEDLDRTILHCGTGGGGMGHFNLRVYRAPQLVNGLVQDALEGARISIALSSGPEAFPFPAKIQWKKDGVLIGNSSAVMLGYPSAIFPEISRTDSGDYSLTATNYHLDDPNVEIGRGNGAFHLNVLYGPDVLKGPSMAVAAQGGNAVLICGSDLSSNPPATILWIDNKRRRVDPDSSRVALNSGPLSVSLTVFSLTGEDAGDWNCSIQVENSRTFHHSIALTVVEAPSEPQNIHLISSGPTWAYLSWSRPISPGFPLSSSKLYVVTAIRTRDGSIHHTPPTANTAANVTGLLPNSHYEFSVLAQSVVDDVIASSSPSVMASTRTTTTVPEIKCQAAPSSNNGTINVTWHYVHTGGLNLTGVSVFHSLESPLPQFQQPVRTQVDATNFVAYGLIAGNSYIFKIVSSNSIGNSSAVCPSVIHDIGTPQTPILYRAWSSHGVLTVEVATNASGTEPGDLFQFNVAARHMVTQEVQTFTVDSREYMSGERALLSLGGFTKSEEGDNYLITVNCTNMFGTSQNSNQVSVVINFTGNLAAPIAGAIGAGVIIIILVLCLVSTLLCVVRCRNKCEVEKRKYSPARHTDSRSDNVSNSHTDNDHQQWTNGPVFNFKENIVSSNEAPQYESIPVKQNTSKQSDVYDSLRPTTQLTQPSPSPSSHSPLPSSSPSTQGQQKLFDNPLCSSTGDITRRERTAVIRQSRSSSCLNVPPLEIRKRFSSVPDLPDQSEYLLDFPAGTMEPISITRDLLELEESFSIVAKSREARRYNNRHLLGYEQNLVNLQSDV